jgi:hypothetical protein
VTVLDPGFHRPVQCASVDACHLLDGTRDAAGIAATAEFDFLDEETWMRDSGRRERGQRERRRRDVNTDYSEALDALAQTRR